MATALKDELGELAATQGFHAVAIGPAAVSHAAREATLARVRRGDFRGLPWFDESRVLRATDPATALAGVRSVIMLAASYRHLLAAPSDDRLRGRVARYAWGRDYHNVLARRAKPLLRLLADRQPGSKSRFVVDHAPFLERPWAREAGIGWQGKNTMILARGVGSWTFLAAILTTVSIEADHAVAPHCGSCHRCLPACPTEALPEPYVLVNDLCISYQTIENRGPIPRTLRPKMGAWIFGCDLCQEICPVNDEGPPALDELRPSDVEDAFPDLLGLLELSEEAFQQRFRGRALLRAKWSGLLRNACVALGNSRDERAVPGLQAALGHPAPLVRGHAAWALGRLGACRALTFHRNRERDAMVLEEIDEALEAA